ncbi:OmpA family protein [Rhodobacteraceae bacterium CCMM004]|nr:OmpA family protein [Rhodobacteraceae bacterium CCMM004]
MLSHTLKSTTAIAVSLALILPAPVLAQSDTAPDDPCAALESAVGEAGAQLRAACEAARANQAAPAEEAPAEEAPVDEAPAEETPAEEAPAEEAAAEETPTEEAPAEETAAEETPAEEAPAEEAAAEETPAEETPAEEAPAEEAVAEETPAEEAPAEGTVAEETPAEETPSGTEAAEAETEAPASEGDTEVGQEDTADSVAAANATVEAEALSGGAAADTQALTITDENARSSDEAFETEAATAAETGGGDGGGLSTLEKFAIGAVGAAAIGALLNQGEKVVSNTGDRVVVQRQNGDYYVLKDDGALVRRPGTEVQVESFADGSSREVATRADGTRIVTIRSSNGQILQRTRILPDGREVVLIDDTAEIAAVETADLAATPAPAPSSRVAGTDTEALRAALMAEAGIDRRYSLRQIRDIRAVRALAPELVLDTVTFDTGSAVITPSQAEELSALGRAMTAAIDENPGEVFLIEGHTDAVGGAAMNLALSDRRAESVALALSEYFDVPPENMVVQGYGESNLKIATQGAERENRRAAVRRITPLLQTAAVK